jgi:hypothetical protein
MKVVERFCERCGNWNNHYCFRDGLLICEVCERFERLRR